MSSLPEELRKTILLVDDQVDVLTVVRRILERAHFNVIQTLSGPLAVKLAEEASTPIDLLLTDVDMPGMSGSELGQVLTGIRPELHVLLMSGQDIRDVGTRCGWAHIQKPFTHDALLEMVSCALSTHPG
jgi:DNA-binding NtrC family response regulator